MTEKTGPGQAAKKSAESQTAAVGAEQQQEAQNSGQVTGADANSPQGAVPDEAKASENDDPSVNPYPNYDFMELEALQSLAEQRGVEINRDVLKAHYVTELRAADSGTTSVTNRRGAR
jgi:hypothetical protein